MKTLNTLFITLLLLAGLSAQATIIVVNNNGNNPGIYSNLQVAVDAASLGDTIFVAGSETTYGDVSIVKQLTLIGAGYNPSTQFHLKSLLGTIYLTHTDASGTKIVGFYIASTIIANVSNISDIFIYRNRINGSIAFNTSGYVNWTNWVIKNNIINGISPYNSTNEFRNSFIQNNIITYQISYLTSSTITISNNVFTTPSSINAFNQMENSIVTNNILYGAGTNGCTGCTFNNNLSFGGPSTDFDYGGNICTGNIENTDPLFEGAASTTFSYGYDYHLQATSPGFHAGTDGNDIGIYGGIYSFPSGGNIPWQTSAMPALPQIMKMNVLNPVLPIAGTLHVKIKAVSQQ